MGIQSKNTHSQSSNLKSVAKLVFKGDMKAKGKIMNKSVGTRTIKKKVNETIKKIGCLISLSSVLTIFLLLMFIFVKVQSKVQTSVLGLGVTTRRNMEPQGSMESGRKVLCGYRMNPKRECLKKGMNVQNKMTMKQLLKKESEN